jgi:hypothetical protein
MYLGLDFIAMYHLVGKITSVVNQFHSQLMMSFQLDELSQFHPNGNEMLNESIHIF